MAQRSPVERHSYWGELSSASDLPNVAGSPTQDDTLREGDTAFVTCAVVVCVDPTVGAARWLRADTGAAGSGEVLVFEWNGTDTSQFEAGPAFASGGWTASLTVVPGVTGDNVLELQGLTGVGTGALIWLASAPLAFAGTDRNQRWELWVDSQVGRYGGVAFAADDSDPAGLHCYQKVWQPAGGWNGRVDAGVLAWNAATTGTAYSALPAYIELHLRSDKLAGQKARVAMASASAMRSTPQYNWYQRQEPSTGAQNFDNAGAPPASWYPLVCDRWGLALQSAGLQAIGTIRFSRIRIWSW